MIRDTVVPYLKRISDWVLSSRNRSRIVLGTDRKDTLQSGYGDGGQNDSESSTIDMVVGFIGSNPSFLEDKTRLYLAEKTNPDEYSGIDAGPAAVGQPAALIISDNIYFVGRSAIKLVRGSSRIMLLEDGSIEIHGKSVKIKTDGGEIDVGESGDISLGSAAGPGARILTENDIGSVVIPGVGTGTCSFQPPGQIFNQKVKIKI